MLLSEWLDRIESRGVFSRRCGLAEEEDEVMEAYVPLLLPLLLLLLVLEMLLLLLWLLLLLLL